MSRKISIPSPLTLAKRAFRAASRSSDPPVVTDEWSDWVGVQSSNVAAVRYHVGESQMEIRFLNGGTYRYSSVPETTFLAFLNAPSKGRYLARVIKPSFKGYRVRGG